MAMQAIPITEILAMGPVMPVIVINDTNHRNFSDGASYASHRDQRSQK